MKLPKLPMLIMKARTVSKAFEIEQKAVRIFLNALPPNWPPRKQDPDFHIDYVIELVEAGELTGVNFGVQVKGFEPTPSRSAQRKYSLLTKHLAYYVDKVEFPVFLVLVDTTNGTVFYEFMQGFGKTAPTGWRSRHSVTINFSELNNFADQFRFSNELARAAEFTRDLHPGSLHAAMGQLKNKIEAIDPRVEVRIDVVNGKNHYYLNPKEDHSFSLQLMNQTPQNKAALVDFIEKGNDLVLKANDIKFENAPLFEKMTEGEIKITHRTETPGHLVFSAATGEPPFHIQIPAIFWQGTKYISMRAEYPNSPIRLETEFQPELWSKDNPFTCVLSVQAKSWEGKVLNELSYFDSIHALLDILANRAGVDVQFFIQGNLYGRVNFGAGDRTGFNRIFAMVDLLRKVREICSKLGGTVIVPQFGEISRDDFRVVNELHKILFHGEYSRKIGQGTLTGVFNDDGSLRQPDPKPAPLTVSYPKPTYKIWDVAFQPGPIQREYSAMRVLSLKRRPKERSVKIKWRGTPESLERTRLVPSKP
jgi:hypothetical protein